MTSICVRTGLLIILIFSSAPKREQVTQVVVYGTIYSFSRVFHPNLLSFKMEHKYLTFNCEGRYLLSYLGGAALLSKDSDRQERDNNVTILTLKY